MSSFDRYIFRTTFGAFLLVLDQPDGGHLAHARVARDRPDDQSAQTVLTFIGITGLLIPMLVW
jgi:hypothetical protein